jgi:DNA-binding NarL/FixJ family response regulator
MRMRALLVDDDVWFQRAFQARFESQLPQIPLEVRSEPNVSGDYAVYLIDNQFWGEARAGELARQIRQTNPEALVIALSSSLDVVTLKTLINEGCNGACEKGNHAEMMSMFDVIRKFFKKKGISDKQTPVPGGSGMVATIRSIADLLREWNSRLDREAKEEMTLSQS